VKVEFLSNSPALRVPKPRHLRKRSGRPVIYALFRRVDAVDIDRGPAADGITSAPGPMLSPTVEFARCFLRLANLPNFALDRLSRYEATLWRQVAQIMFALDALDRRKPWYRWRRFRHDSRQDLPPYESDEV